MADNREIPLPQSSITEKRGRGRPRKSDALTNAQRQAAYRARHQASNKSVTVTKKEYDALLRDCEQLREALARAQRDRIAQDDAPKRTEPDAGPASVTAILMRSVPPDQAESEDRRVLVQMNGREVFSLERLEAHFGLSRRAVLERIIWWADRSIVQSLGDDDEAFNRYLNRITKNW